MPKRSRAPSLVIDFARIIQEAGGASSFAAKVGCNRRTPYKLINGRGPGHRLLAKILVAYPRLNLRRYIEVA